MKQTLRRFQRQIGLAQIISGIALIIASMIWGLSTELSAVTFAIMGVSTLLDFLVFNEVKAEVVDDRTLRK